MKLDEMLLKWNEMKCAPYRRSSNEIGRGRRASGSHELKSLKVK